MPPRIVMGRKFDCMTRLGPARIHEADADNDSFVSWSTRDIKREVEALKTLHEAVKSTIGASEPLSLGFCALLVLRRELSEIRRSIDSASRRLFSRG
jgi:ribosomal 50S subunit-associated protein YjgA (DUF615 family)